MNDPVQTMPEVNAMVKDNYSVRDWLNYYKNVWVRNLTARLIDVQTDSALKALGPDEMVPSDDGRGMPVKQRLEMRKILVQDAVDLIAGIDAMIALTDEQLVAAQSKEALAVAEDMKPAEPKAGDPCDVGGKPGTLQDKDGALVCVVTEAPAAGSAEEKKDEPSAEAKV